ncbi:hypothetical protein LDENG_00105560 [Lucifuga dentata]|nr:hypothetical protein LDENG_00105560 [Lucifuga dentata]
MVRISFKKLLKQWNLSGLGVCEENRALLCVISVLWSLCGILTPWSQCGQETVGANQQRQEVKGHKELHIFTDSVSQENIWSLRAQQIRFVRATLWAALRAKRTRARP